MHMIRKPLLTLLAAGSMGLCVTGAHADINGIASTTIGAGATQFTSNGNPTGTKPTASTPTIHLTTTSTGEANSIWYNTKQSTAQFTATFIYQYNGGTGDTAKAAGDGITFTLQNKSLTALGASGANLGYGATGGAHNGAVTSSFAVFLDLDNTDPFLRTGYGSHTSTGFVYSDGTSTVAGPANGVSTNPVKWTNSYPTITPGSPNPGAPAGDDIAVTIAYDGTTLIEKFHDRVTNADYLTSYVLPLSLSTPGGYVGANTAWVGFTGSTGSATADQTITNFVYKETFIDPRISTVVPEQSSVASLGIGGLALTLLLVRRRKASKSA